MNSRIALAAGLALAALTTEIATAETVWLDQLDVRTASQGWGEPQKNKSVGGNALSIGGKTFEHGFGTHAESILHINLGGGAQSFAASVGVDDEVGGNRAASVEFIVVGDGRELWKSGVLHAGDAAKDCAVNLSGVKLLTLKVGDADDGNSYDHADWGDAKFETDGAKTFVASGEEMPEPVAPYILTPPAPATPRINGADVFGVRPGSPFLFTIPATGERPMKFSAKNLPDGLKLDAKTGRITGALKKQGEFVVTLRAKNILGKAEKSFRIVCGDQIALTPPMGWNSWNCFAHAVSADRVKRAADALVKSGLVNHGWTYINIDDFWENHRDSNDPTLHGDFRDAKGFVVPNSRFPDMKGLADYVHGLGLKIGLYSSPGPWTCGGCTGSFQHEAQDAQTYAQWGFDYLKYDWCSYGSIADGKQATDSSIPSWSEGKGKSDIEVAIYPYRLMGKFLHEQKRDIVFSLCQYGMSDVWNWGGSVNGQSWRTTGDITDTWRSMSDIGFKQDKAAPLAKPGNWNDPDMLIVGEVGWGKTHPTRLTTDEQYTHISLWCLLSAPLLIGCDMEKFDDFTLSLLSNDEVLAIDQDALGKEAMCAINHDTVRIYKKDLADGGHAIGFFNLGAQPVDLSFNEFAPLGLAGRQHVRDLWRQKNLADVDTLAGSLPLTIPAHGVLLYKFKAAK
ncbi:MAG: NPCBM/NEW2 domain-containing protein [Verrucomicrobiae bacterium]|nr:NPCBM/NEW2 domain-containing protein [Verrucomicrobiae bacterium]